jgi:hypothetical protein
MPGQRQTIDYDALAQQHGAVSSGQTIDYDSLAQQHGAIQATGDKGSSWQEMDPNALQEQIKSNPFRVLQIPFEQLGATAGRAHDQLADKMLSDAAKGKGVSKADYVKSFLLGSAADASKMTAGAVSPKGIGVATATALAPEVMGPILLAHGTVGAAENAPAAFRSPQAGESKLNPLNYLGDPNAVQGMFASGSEAAGGGAVTGGAYGAGASTPIRDIWNANKVTLRRLSGAMQTPQQAAKVPGGSTFSPPRAVSNQDVINWAQSEGIDLTPAQETGSKGAHMVQGIGEQTLTPGGKPLQDALELNRGKVEQAVENFSRRFDPHALGSSPESAGDALKTSAKVALEVAKDNANIAYKQAGIDQANIAVDVRTPLQKFINDQRMVRQPGAAVAQSEYKSPAVEAALKDIQNKINDPRLGANASVQSARNLRTEFWEKANDYSGTIPDAAKGIYKMASQIPDSAMMNAAKGTPFEQSFRDASQQWADLKSKFDTSGEPLNKLLQASDSKQAYNSIVGGKSADVIAKLKAENIDLGPIQSQVVRDIAGKGFRVTGNTLAGYPDSFLQQLFGADGVRELYTASETARRLNIEANASGSGRMLIAKDQIGWNPSSWVRGEAAAQVSMPRPAGKTVGNAVPILPTYQSLTPKTIALRSLLGGTGASQSAEEGR